MSRTHKERYKWKRKERKRTGQRDPKKIALHRERFLERVSERTRREIGYAAAVFRVRLQYDLQTFETVVMLDGEVISKIPYLVEDVTETHFAIHPRVPKFSAQLENPYLRRHVNHVRINRKRCHLQVDEDGKKLCTSCLSCRFRKWNAEQQVPECTLS